MPGERSAPLGDRPAGGNTHLRSLLPSPPWLPGAPDLSAELFASVIDDGNVFGGGLDADDIRGLLA